MCFKVVDNLAIDLLLETSSVDKYIQRIFPAKCRLVPWYSKPVDMIVPTTQTHNNATVANHIACQSSSISVDEDAYHKVVVSKVSKAVTLASYTHTPELVKELARKRKFLNPYTTALATRPFV